VLGATKADGRELPPPPSLTTSLSSGLYRSGKKKLPARAAIHIYKMNLLVWRTRVFGSCGWVSGGGFARSAWWSGEGVDRRAKRSLAVFRDALLYIFHLTFIHFVLLSPIPYILYICIIHIAAAATVHHTTRGLPRVRALDPVHQLQAKQRIISIGPPLPPPFSLYIVV